MKKKLLFIFSGIAIVSIAAFNSYYLKSGNLQYCLTIANVEALAATESTSFPVKCYDIITSNGNSTHVTYCGDCKAALCKGWTDEYTCNP